MRASILICLCKILACIIKWVYYLYMDRIVVITGGTSGIGYELKCFFEAFGDRVITISRRIIADDVCHYACDVTDKEQLKKVFADIVTRFGRVDVLVNNAGYGLSGITELLETDAIKKQFDVNFMGVVNASQCALQYMQKGGKIINISSAMALFPVPYRAMYASSKSAVLTLSYAMRMELKGAGIDVVAICPGDIRTPFTQNREKHYDTNNRYGDCMERVTLKLDSKQNKRMDVKLCAQKIYKIINKKRTKPMYIIGAKYKFLYFISNITPKSWLINITGKMLDGRNYEKNRDSKTK